MHVVNSTDRPIRLGRCGENLVTQVKFDIARWLGELGDGTAVLLVQRPDDAEPYMAEVSRDGASVVWDVTAVDTASAGFGSCELQYIIGERIAKSAVFMTDVAAALGDPSEDAPDPFVAWEQRVVLASVAAQEAAAQIINMQVRAVTLEPDEEAYVQTAVVEDVYQMTFGIPRGHDGQGGGGTGDHSRLSNRDLNDQHPMEAITGLMEALLAKYVKPDGGIPASDLSSGVQSSLNKADSALQEHQSLAAYRTGAQQDVIDSGKQPTLVSGQNVKTINNQSILGSGNLEVSGLPSVTAADEGSILMVVNGAWQVVKTWVEPEQSGGTVTIQSVYQAVQNGNTLEVQ